MFLSGKWLVENGSAIISQFDPARVDCAAYTMRVGGEAYVSPESRDTREPGLLQLPHQAPIAIPPGQFAFLVTREFLTVPYDLIAFINMKNGLKVSGLVNVSGFHVDPGYEGKLVFAVFNAGPQTVTVRADQPAFLIWFAQLAQASEDYSRKKGGFRGIDTELMGLIPAETASLNSLKERIDKLDRRFGYVIGTLTIAGSFAVAAIAGILASGVFKIWGD